MAKPGVELGRKKSEEIAQIRKLDETASALERDMQGHLAPRKDESLVELQQLREQLLRFVFVVTLIIQAEWAKRPRAAQNL